MTIPLAVNFDVPQTRAATNFAWDSGNRSGAIDYAIASVEQAKLAVLDAIDGRVAAEEAKQA